VARHIEGVAALFENVRDDVKRVTGSSLHGFRSQVRAFMDYGLEALLAYRLGRYLRTASSHAAAWPFVILLTPLYWVLAAMVRVLYDIHLAPSADIGPGLRIYHFGGIRLEHCRVGAHCVIHHEVVIEPSAGESEGPIIGSRVWIGPHARISGRVRIGDGATVGAGAVIVHDVPANGLALGRPARTVWVGYDNRSFPGVGEG
jgi:serine O-acetyltransferase